MERDILKKAAAYFAIRGTQAAKSKWRESQAMARNLTIYQVRNITAAVRRPAW
jgi:hypothetical protein